MVKLQILYKNTNAGSYGNDALKTGPFPPVV